MNLARYNFQSNRKHLDYEFFSDGPKGTVKKVVRFTLLEDDGTFFYNVAFGDWDEENKQLDDLNITNNLDPEKVLATVAAIIYDFTLIYPMALIFAEGSTPSRTRRYQMGIAKIWEEIEPSFDVYGITAENTVEIFQRNINYAAFWIRRK